MDGSQDHWEGVWAAKAPDQVSWYQPSSEPCITLVRELTDCDDHIAVVGAGVSTLIAELVEGEYTRIEAIDIAQGALDQLRSTLGPGAANVVFHQCDVRDVTFDEPVDLWHDRATFHFLIDPSDQQRYARSAARAVRPGGHVVMGTFALDGPDMCSGLPVQRYDAASLSVAFEPDFELIRSFERDHHTPMDTPQRFLHAVLRRQ